MIILFFLFLFIPQLAFGQQSSSSASYTNAKAQAATGWTKTGASVYLTTSTDDVGVGVSIPQEKLHVSGDVYITGNERIQSEITDKALVVGGTQGDPSYCITEGAYCAGGDYSNCGSLNDYDCANDSCCTWTPSTTCEGTNLATCTIGDCNGDYCNYTPYSFSCSGDPSFNCGYYDTEYTCSEQSSLCSWDYGNSVCLNIACDQLGVADCSTAGCTPNETAEACDSKSCGDISIANCTMAACDVIEGGSCGSNSSCSCDSKGLQDCNNDNSCSWQACGDGDQGTCEGNGCSWHTGYDASYGLVYDTSTSKAGINISREPAVALDIYGDTIVSGYSQFGSGDPTTYVDGNWKTTFIGDHSNGYTGRMKNISSSGEAMFKVENYDNSMSALYGVIDDYAYIDASSGTGHNQVRALSNGNLTTFIAENIGIGTTAPTTSLEIYPGTGHGLAVGMQYPGWLGDNGIATSGLSFLGAGVLLNTGSNVQWGAGAEKITADTSAHSLSLYSNSAERVTINSSGNVGIGTTSPIARLQINTDNALISIPNGLTLANDITVPSGTSQSPPALTFIGHSWTGVGTVDQRTEHRLYSYNANSTNPGFNIDLREVGSGNDAWRNIFQIDQNGGFVTPIDKTTWAIRETLSLGVNLGADESASASYDEFSPYLRFRANGWKTNATAGMQEVVLGMLNAPEQGAISPIGTFRFIYGTNNTVPSISNELMRFMWGSDTTVLGMYVNNLNLPNYKTVINGNVGIGTTAPEQTLAVTGTARFGSLTNSTTFEADGTMVFNGSATVYNDIIINATNLRAGASAPTWQAFQGNIYEQTFMNATTDLVYGSAEIPHGYQEGKDLDVHVHWSPSSTNTGAMTMSFEYTFSPMGGGFAGTNRTLTCTQAGGGTALAHQYVDCGNIPGNTLKIGTVVTFVLSRPTGDAFTGDAFVHDVGMHYPQDTIGSRTETSK